MADVFRELRVRITIVEDVAYCKEKIQNRSREVRSENLKNHT
jgi:hypothetical protein